MGCSTPKEGRGALYLTPRELIESSFKSGMRARALFALGKKIEWVLSS